MRTRSEKEAARSIGARGLYWVRSNLDQFPVNDIDNDTLLVRKIKPIAELALTCDLLKRTCTARALGDPSFPQRILSFCWAELKEGELLGRLLINYPDLFSLVTVYPPFFRAGLRNRRLELIIAELVRDRSISALEFPPWRLLDFATALRAIGIPSPWSEGKVFGDTWVGKRPSPWTLSDSSAYSLTHSVFYQTDFGFNRRGVPRDVREYLRRWIGVWMEYYVRCENLDLLSEFMMVAYCIGVSPSPSSFNAIRGAQRHDGAVPGPIGLSLSLGIPKRKSARGATFLHDYHTTLVAIMACALCAKR